MLLKSLQRTFSTTCNHYELLKIRPNATYHDIKVAYRQLAKLHHPDIGKTK
jgi:curved DNA-binding protein CbpA